ncbi:MAG: PilN domain-containing protein [Desulfitobacteriaceae bacterium]
MSRIMVTVEITDQELKVLWFLGKNHVKRVPQGARLNFDLIPIPTGVIDQGILRDKDVFMGLLQIYFAQKKLVGLIVVNLLIPFQLGFLRTYRLPWIAKSDRKSAIGFLIDEEVPIPGADLLSDFIILEENRENNLCHILVGATRKSLLQAYVEAFLQVGFQVENIDFAISALGYALGLENKEESLYLRAESGRLQLILFCGISPEVVRTLVPDPTLGSPDAEWESEIQRILLYYGNQHPELSLKRIYTAGEGVADLLAERLQRAGMVSQVQKADSVRIPDSWKKTYPEWQDNAKAVMGYVLRILQKAPGLNLWRHRAVRKRTFLFSKTILGIVMLGMIAGILIWFSLQYRVIQLENEVEQLRSQGTETLTLVNQQKELNKAWLKAQEHSIYVGEHLAGIQRLLPRGVDLSHLEYKEGRLSLQGTTDNAEHFEGLLKALESSGLEQPLLTGYQQTDQASIQFSLKTGDNNIVNTKTASTEK